MAETVAERVIAVFAEFKKMPPEDIKMETTFEELGLDSLDGLNLIFELEEEFDLNVPDDKIKDFKSVAQVVEGMEMLVEAKAQGIDIEAEAAKDFAAQQAAFKAHKAAQETAEKNAETEEKVSDKN